MQRVVVAFGQLHKPVRQGCDVHPARGLRRTPPTYTSMADSHRLGLNLHERARHYDTLFFLRDDTFSGERGSHHPDRNDQSRLRHPTARTLPIMRPAIRYVATHSHRSQTPADAEANIQSLIHDRATLTYIPPR